jgi:Putative zinc-finger
VAELLKMHPSDDLLDAYLLGNLSPEEENDIEEHYLCCPACVGRLSATEDFISKLKAGLVELPRVRAGIPLEELVAPSSISTTPDANPALRLKTREFIKELVASAHGLTGSEPTGKTLREDLQELADLYSQIENLKGICRGQEEILLRRMMQGDGLERLDRITQAYRSACSSREPPWDNLHEIRERACFWFHIGRIRLACALWRLGRTPRLCCSLVIHSLNALEVLTPGVLEVMQAGLPQNSSGIVR